MNRFLMFFLILFIQYFFASESLCNEIIMEEEGIIESMSKLSSSHFNKKAPYRFHIKVSKVEQEKIEGTIMKVIHLGKRHQSIGDHITIAYDDCEERSRLSINGKCPVEYYVPKFKIDQLYDMYIDFQEDSYSEKGYFYKSIAGQESFTENNETRVDCTKLKTSDTKDNNITRKE